MTRRKKRKKRNMNSPHVAHGCTLMDESVLSINERPARIARTSPSNLVSLSGTPDVGQSLPQTPTSSNPLSRNQRCFPQVNRKINCFDGGLVVTQQALWVPRPYLALKRSQATFKAVCGTQTRMPEGFKLMKSMLCLRPLTTWRARFLGTDHTGSLSTVDKIARKRGKMTMIFSDRRRQ